MDARIFINATEVTDYWDAQASSIVKSSSDRAGTASIILENAGVLSINSYDQIVIVSADLSTVYFAGFILEPDIGMRGISQVLRCRCVGYTSLASKRRVNEIYENYTSRELLSDVCTRHMPEVDIAYLSGLQEVGQVLQVPYHESLGTAQRTIYLKVLVSADGDGELQYLASQLHYSIIDSGWLIRRVAGGDLWLYGYGAGGNASCFIDEANFPPPGSILHIVARFDTSAKTGDLWCFGSHAAVSNFAVTALAEPVNFCGHTEVGPTPKPLYGNLYRAKMWNVLLADADCELLSMGMIAAGDHEADVCLDLKLNECKGSVVTDSSAYSNDGAITKMYWSMPYFTEEGVDTGKLIYQLKKASDVCTEIAGINAWDWLIDDNRILHMQTPAEVAASFGLSDSPNGVTTFPYELLSFRESGSQVINRITVRGGEESSDDQDREYPGDGQNTITLLDYKLHAPDGESGILVYTNVGSDVSPSWSAQSVGIDHVDDDKLGDTIDVLFNYQEKLLRWNTAPPDLKRAVKIHCKIDTPIYLTVRNQDSYDAYGVWIDGDPIVDKSITTTEMAKLRGYEKLTEYQFAAETGVAVITQDGLEVGQTLSVVSAKRGINDSYLIQGIQTNFLGNEVAEHRITFGLYCPDLIDIIRKIKSLQDAFAVSDNMELTLNEVFDVEESIGVDDTANFDFYHDTEAWTWGMDTDEFDWSFGTWG